MIKVIDMAGAQIGDWTVLRKDETRSEKYAYWICRCKCGEERSVNGSSLRSGGSKGCGCARAEKLRQLMKQTAWASSPENAQRAKRGLCYNVFCPRRDSYKGAWNCRYCHGCAGRETQRRSKREVLEI